MLFSFLIFLFNFARSDSANLSVQQRASNAVLNEINVASCRRNLRIHFPGQQITTTNEHGNSTYRLIGKNGERVSLIYYDQPPSPYLAGSKACRIDISYFNPERRQTHILRYEDQLNEFRERVGDIEKTKITAPNGNYLMLIQNGFNDVSVSFHFKGPPEETIQLHAYRELTAELVNNLKNGNINYFRNSNNPAVGPSRSSNISK